jgi:hypothetical protein
MQHTVDLGLNLFNLTPITSARYPGDSQTPLHTHLMHTQDRSATQQLTSFDGTTMKDLNRMPVDFAREIVQLWRVFVQHLQARATNGRRLRRPSWMA